MGSKQPNVTIRINRTEGYTTISTYHLWDKRLSLKAKGLLSSLLATPPGWSASVAGFVAICKDGKAGVTAALKELEEAGYVIRKRLHDGSGHFMGMEYIVNERPQTQQEVQATAETAEQEPFAENRQMDEPNQPFTDFPATENPLTEKPPTENQPQVNNINKLTNKKSTPKPPEGAEDEKETPKKGKIAYSAEFEQFWAAYPSVPYQVSKSATFKAWKREIRKSDVPVVMRTLERVRKCEQWSKEGGRFIPSPKRWIGERMWEGPDETPAAPAPAGPPEREVELW